MVLPVKLLAIYTPASDVMATSSTIELTTTAIIFATWGLPGRGGVDCEVFSCCSSLDSLLYHDGCYLPRLCSATVRTCDPGPFLTSPDSSPLPSLEGIRSWAKSLVFYKLTNTCLIVEWQMGNIRWATRWGTR
jgi:hypothetical protein